VLTKGLPFSRIVISEGTASREMSASEFLSIPIHTRVRALLDGRVRFVSDEQDIAPQAALKALRAQQVA